MACLRAAAAAALAAACTLVVAAALGVPGGGGCAAGAGAACGRGGSDEAGLLQVAGRAPCLGSQPSEPPAGDGGLLRLQAGPVEVDAANRTDAPWFCPPWAKVVRKSQAAPLVDKHLKGDPRVAWWSMVKEDSAKIYRDFQSKLTPLPLMWDTVLRGELVFGTWGIPGMRGVAEHLEELTEKVSFGSGSPATVVRMMYEATKTPGDFKSMPDQFKGVFWMKGNGIAEELVTLQHGRWFADEQMLVVPFLPFSWAWPASRPPRPPFRGVAYMGLPGTALYAAAGQVIQSSAFSFKFDRCPKGAKYCHAGQWDNLAYASMQYHLQGNMAESFNVGDIAAFRAGGLSVPPGTYVGAFTLQATTGGGTAWKRTNFWGLRNCASLEFGTYDLVKIIDGKGNPVVPHYRDFLRYMGAAKLFAWAGWRSEAARIQAQEIQENITEAQ